MGNKKVRTILLCSLLVAFVVFGYAYWDYNYKQLKDFPELLKNDTIKQKENSYLIIMISAAIIAAFAIMAAILNFLSCGLTIARICGFGLIIGGIGYLIGVFLFMDANKCDSCTGDSKKRNDAELTIILAEGLAPSVTAILLGCDVMMDLFTDEHKRLFSNLGLLCIVGFMLAGGYGTRSDTATALTSDDRKNAWATIASGGSIFAIFALIYVILYVFTCCTCDMKDSCFCRLIFAVGLVVGGLICAAGYYAYADTISHDETTTYYIGLTVLIAGLCILWAIDIMFDDFQKTRKK
jgi:uncharacterized membrane protein